MVSQEVPAFNCTAGEGFHLVLSNFYKVFFHHVFKLISV